MTFERLVVFGCSLTKDNFIDTWADILSQKISAPLLNFAERGAGYDYIAQKVISAPINFDSDLVVIMWPSSDRYDLYVDSSTPHLQRDIGFASWLDGKAPAFVDNDGQYNRQKGWYINGAVPRGYKHKYYKYFYNQTYHVNKAWSMIVLVQNYLENNGGNYVMCNSYPLLNPTQYHHSTVTDFNTNIYKKINLERFVKDADIDGFINITKKNDFVFFNPHHPNSDGHRWYVENYILSKIK